MARGVYTRVVAVAVAAGAAVVASPCSAFHLSPAQCASLGIDPNPDGNHIVFNKATGNGASPSPLIAPLSGAGLPWDGMFGTGSGELLGDTTPPVPTFSAQLLGCRGWHQRLVLSS